MNRDKLTRSEQREAARAKAKEMREQHKKSEKRKRLALQVGVGAVVLAIIGVVSFAMISGAKKELVTPANFSFNNGIKIGTDLEAFTATSTPAPGEAGSNVPNIQLYLDYQCPICKGFELPNQSQIESWVSEGIVTLEIHPVSFLDTQSLNSYSSRAANAAVCVAENSPNSFFKFSSALFENQPAEGSAGPSNDELFKTAQSVGISNEAKIKSCIDAKTYDTWLSNVTQSFMYEPFPFAPDLDVQRGTPMIFVNNELYSPATLEELYSPARFAQFVQTFTEK